MRQAIYLIVKILYNKTIFIVFLTKDKKLMRIMLLTKLGSQLTSEKPF